MTLRGHKMFPVRSLEAINDVKSIIEGCGIGVIPFQMSAMIIGYDNPSERGARTNTTLGKCTLAGSRKLHIRASSERRSPLAVLMRIRVVCFESEVNFRCMDDAGDDASGRSLRSQAHNVAEAAPLRLAPPGISRTPTRTVQTSTKRGSEVTPVLLNDVRYRVNCTLSAGEQRVEKDLGLGVWWWWWWSREDLRLSIRSESSLTQRAITRTVKNSTVFETVVPAFKKSVGMSSS